MYGSYTSSIVSDSSPTAAARLSTPTGPPSNLSIIAPRIYRSISSNPAVSISSRPSAVAQPHLTRHQRRLVHLPEIAPPPQQSIRDSRRPPRARRKLLRARLV